jgi:hypothetical protein
MQRSGIQSSLESLFGAIGPNRSGFLPVGADPRVRPLLVGTGAKNPGFPALHPSYT